MGFSMPVGGIFWGVITVIFGAIVLIFPKLLNYLVGMYLIIIGIITILSSL
jgi:hypothetical protein